MNADSFMEAIAPLLKSNGFKKSNATWRRKRSESVAVLNVQKSSWGRGDYYINLEVYFLALGSALHRLTLNPRIFLPSWEKNLR